MAHRRVRKYRRYYKPKRYRPMNQEDIEDSRKKLGFSDNKPNGICNANNCNKPVNEICIHCHRQFCRFHHDATLAMSAAQKFGIKQHEDPILYEKINKDWNRKDGHACAEYTTWWYKDHERQTELDREAINQSWKNKEANYGPREEVRTPPRNNEPIYNEDVYKLKPDPYEKYAPQNEGKKTIFRIMEAIILSIIVLLIFSFVSSNTNLSQFLSSGLNDLKNTIKSIQITNTTTSLILYNSSSTINSTNKINNSSYCTNDLQCQVMTNACNATNCLVNVCINNTCQTRITNLAGSTGSPTTTTRNLLQNTSQNIFGSQINAQWVTNFNSNLSIHRNKPLAECSTLDQFAKIRFNTMTSGNNWGISHYGYINDSTSFMNGKYYYYSGEVVLYPDGYSPQSYIPYLVSQAPLHYDLLIDGNFSYYGYYVGSGSVVSVYPPCSVTEIPGPNINVRQFFQQNGCQIAISNTTWLVVDLSALC